MAEIEQSIGYGHDREFFKEGKVKARERSGVERFSDIPLREQPKVRWKWEYCFRFQAMVRAGKAERSNEGMEAAIAIIAAEIAEMDCARKHIRVDAKGTVKDVVLKADGTPRKTRSGTQIVVREPPCYRTLQRWLAILEACAWNDHALRDGYRNCGDHRPKLEPDVEEKLVEVAQGYATQGRPTMALQFDRLEIAIGDLNETRTAKGLPLVLMPSRRRLYAEIRDLDAYWTYGKRYTQEAADKKFAGVDAGPMATRLGERIEMDEWKVSLRKLMIRAKVWKLLPPEARAEVTRARWWLSAAIDRASRCVLAMRLSEKTSSAAAIATIRMIHTDKTDLSNAAGALSTWHMATGIGTIVTDWGSAYRADETKRVVLSMGATYTHPPVSTPGMRGTIERLFGTTERRFMPHFTGRTFSNVVEKGDYDAGVGASMPVEDWARLLVRHVVDDYHNRPHHGLGGETPANAWRRLMKETGRIAIPDRNVQRAIYGIEKICTLDGSGVEMFGLQYNNRELHGYFLSKGIGDVLVRVDPEDAGFASVKLGDEWITVPCKRRDLRGVSVAVWKETQAELRARFTDQAEVSRPIVLEALRAADAAAAEFKREAGIVDAFDKPGQLEMARERLASGFRLPEWDEDGADDPFDHVIPVVGPVASEDEPTEPLLPAEPPAPTWRMGSRNENNP